MAFKGFPIKLIPESSKQDLLGFDLNDEHLKIAHVRTAQLKREVENLFSTEVRGLSEDEIVATVKKTVAGFGVKNPRVFLCVPLHLVITRSIEIPSRDPEEIREIVNLQASRHTPYSRAEIIIDTLILGVVRESYTKVLLVIVPKDVVARQTAILERAGLHPERVIFGPEGIALACGKILGNESSESLTAIVHMDDMLTGFMVVHKNKILFVRGIPIGANHLLEEKEVYADRFVDELQKSLESYLTDEIGPMPSTLILTGVVGEITDLDELFSRTLQIPTKHQTYFKHFPISNQAKQVASGSKRVSFFNLIAPLLLHEKIKIDLISDERKLKMQLERRGRDMVTTGVLAMLILSLVFAVMVEKLSFKKAYLDKLHKRYDPVRQDAKNLEAIFAKTQVVKDYLATRGESVEALSELYETLPAEVRLSEIKYDESGKFSVKGTSSTMSSVFAFVTALERSPKFKSVKTKYVTTRPEKGVDVADFEIASVIEGHDA
jgi:Tfp pilus assembly PilM family ATPase/Tfp pilus assembly protein PilN